MKKAMIIILMGMFLIGCEYVDQAGNLGDVHSELHRETTIKPLTITLENNMNQISE